MAMAWAPISFEDTLTYDPARQVCTYDFSRVVSAALPSINNTYTITLNAPLRGLGAALLPPGAQLKEPVTDTLYYNTQPDGSGATVYQGPSQNGAAGSGSENFNVVVFRLLSDTAIQYTSRLSNLQGQGFYQGNAYLTAGTLTVPVRLPTGPPQPPQIDRCWQEKHQPGLKLVHTRQERGQEAFAYLRGMVVALTAPRPHLTAQSLQITGVEQQFLVNQGQLAETHLTRYTLEKLPNVDVNGVFLYWTIAGNSVTDFTPFPKIGATGSAVPARVAPG